MSNSLMLDLVRAAALHNFDTVVKAFGGDHLSLFKQVNLPENLLDNPEIFFQYNDFITLLNWSAIQLKQNAFGLHLGSQQGLEIFGSIGYLLKNCETVGEALINLKRFFHSHQTTGDIGILINGNEVTLTFTININVNSSTVQAIDLAVSTGVKMLKTLTSEKIKFNAIHFQHSEPKNKRDYKNYLGNVPIFNSTFNGVVFPKSILDMPIDKADPHLFNILSAQLSPNTIGYVDEIPNFVEKIIRQNIATTPMTIEDIASLMALSVRNLQRYLKAEKTSFRKIVDNVRNKLACQYLIDSSLSLSHISDVVGFSNYSEFSRSFKRWNQTSPKDYRNLHSPRKRFSRLTNL